MTQRLIQHLSQFVTPERFALFTRIAKQRTNYISVLLEDIFQSHNASAVLRSCDCFGVQHVHIVENENEYTVNPDVALGASNWLSLHRHNSLKNNTLQSIRKLKEQGFRLVATTPHVRYTTLDLHDFDITKGKFVLMFGSELPGLTETALQKADEFLKIPMFGFTESFNISVSAAIILQHLRMKLETSGINFKLSEEEQERLILQWLKVSVKKSDVIVEKFLAKNT